MHTNRPANDRTKFLLMAALALAILAVAAPASSAQTWTPGCCLASTGQSATAEEAKSLAFMREEEKLARDVYQQLYAKWKYRVFANIVQSEQRHFEAVGVLIARYGVTDPAAHTAAGVFADPALSALYNELVAKGSLSLKDALEVGALIEKKDIEDLETALKATDKADIKTVYANLLAGSLNHQEAFDNVLELLGQ
jgi:hypothetical protein